MKILRIFVGIFIGVFFAAAFNPLILLRLLFALHT